MRIALRFNERWQGIFAAGRAFVPTQEKKEKFIIRN